MRLHSQCVCCLLEPKNLVNPTRGFGAGVCGNARQNCRVVCGNARPARFAVFVKSSFGLQTSMRAQVCSSNCAYWSRWSAFTSSFGVVLERRRVDMPSSPGSARSFLQSRNWCWRQCRPGEEFNRLQVVFSSKASLNVYCIREMSKAVEISRPM